MLVWGSIVSALAIGCVAVFWWVRSRRLEAKYTRLAGQASRVKRGRDIAQEREVLKSLYALVHQGINVKNTATAYRTIDLIKMVFGEGIVRPDEPRQLTTLVVRAARAKELETAAAALDAFRQLLRRCPPDMVPTVMEQLTYIAAIAMKDRHNFLAAKSMEVMFAVLEKEAGSPASVFAALRALKTVGVLALRRKDQDMFREIATRLAELVPAPLASEPATELVALTGMWLHRIVQDDDHAMFCIVAELVGAVNQRGVLGQDSLVALTKDWQNLAGTASLRPNSILAPLISEMALKTALRFWDLGLWEEAVGNAGQTAKMIIQRNGLKTAFPLVLPILETGRELLSLELKFGNLENTESFRQRALFYTVRVCLSLADYAARQDMISTPGDSITEMYNLWMTIPDRTGSKSAKRFCQLLAAYWFKTGTKQAKRGAVGSELSAPALLTDNDKQRLSFLL